MITGSEGNDYISVFNGGSIDTVIGGAGDDTITLFTGARADVYGSGEGGSGGDSEANKG